MWGKWFILGFLFFISSYSYTASFDPQPFKTAVQNTPVLVRGTIGMKYSDYGADDEGVKRLYTYYEVKIQEVFKGDLPTPTITIREMGGEKDGTAIEVTGAAEFKTGEDVVVFLKNKNSENAYDVREMMMGKYEITVDSNGNEYLKGPGLSEVTLLSDLRKITQKASTASNTQEIQRSISSSTQTPSIAPPQTSPQPSWALWVAASIFLLTGLVIVIKTKK